MTTTSHATKKSVNKQTKSTKSEKEFPICACGCGNHTRGGKFRTGHDMVLKSRLLNEKKAKGKTKAVAKPTKRELATA